MDIQIIQDVADSVAKLKMFPYFDICNFILMAISVKDDTPQCSSVTFSRRHPFACWLSTMLMCFGGSILCSFVASEPIFSCFDDHRSVILSTIVWYLINYSPFDIVYRACKLFPVRVLICTFKEIQRARKINLGVFHGIHHFGGAPSTSILLGLLKGSGYCEMKLLERLVRGVWLPASTEFLHPTMTSKMTLLASICYYLNYMRIIPLEQNYLMLIITLIMIYLRISMLLLGLRDPFQPFENIISTIFFGGLVDAIKAAFDKQISGTKPDIGPDGKSQSANGNTVNQAGMNAQTGAGNGSIVLNDSKLNAQGTDKKND